MPRTAIPDTDFMIGDRHRVICLGDSITAAEDSYVAICRNLITAAYPERHIHVINAGTGGNRSVDILARLDRDAISQRPDWIVVNVGVNDVWHGANGVALNKYRQCLNAIATQILEKSSAHVVFMTPTIIGEELENDANRQLEGYCHAMEDIARDFDFILSPTHEEFIGVLRRGLTTYPGFRLTTDGVHMNPIGNYAMALSLLRTLRFRIG